MWKDQTAESEWFNIPLLKLASDWKNSKLQKWTLQKTFCQKHRLGCQNSAELSWVWTFMITPFFSVHATSLLFLNCTELSFLIFIALIQYFPLSCLTGSHSFQLVFSAHRNTKGYLQPSPWYWLPQCQTVSAPWYRYSGAASLIKCCVIFPV